MYTNIQTVLHGQERLRMRLCVCQRERSRASETRKRRLKEAALWRSVRLARGCTARETAGTQVQRAREMFYGRQEIHSQARGSLVRVSSNRQGRRCRESIGFAVRGAGLFGCFASWCFNVFQCPARMDTRPKKIESRKI